LGSSFTAGTIWVSNPYRYPCLRSSISIFFSQMPLLLGLLSHFYRFYPYMTRSFDFFLIFSSHAPLLDKGNMLMVITFAIVPLFFHLFYPFCLFLRNYTWSTRFTAAAGTSFFARPFSFLILPHYFRNEFFYSSSFFSLCYLAGSNLFLLIDQYSKLLRNSMVLFHYHCGESFNKIR